MKSPTSKLPIRCLFVTDQFTEETTAGRAVRALADDLEMREVTVIEADTLGDAKASIASDAGIQCVILDWDIGTGSDKSDARDVLAALRSRNDAIPVFLLAERTAATSIPTDILQDVDDFIWLLEDTSDFIGGRIIAATERYRSKVLPPMFNALAKFARVYEYSWHTPGHTGGTAFLKHPAGRAFFSFFGEEMFRSDLSISVGELGSLLDHSGAIGEGEKYAARVFGAHRTYTVTNGSSTSNRVIMMASVTRDEIALCDRNCHKSIEHAMTMSGAIPTYLVPTRNHYGLIGPIPPEHLTPAAIKLAIDNNPLAAQAPDRKPVHAVITNSTYDGLCYNVTRVEELLGGTVDRLHFDEAWYGYARFNPMYKDRHAMHGDAKAHDASKPTVFATQSTHKLLAALSQASFIHVRDGRNAIPHARFNESFMMHASTSPQYAIIASNDVSAAMMDGPSGPALTTESIREAVGFRQTLARINQEFAVKGDWFFNGWQPETVRDRNSGRVLPFHEAPEELLVTDPLCWILKPGEAWHGFGDIEDGYCMLDPIKVSVTTPGVVNGGGLAPVGIPASILTAYLDEQGIVVEKTTDFTILFLFSLGITKGKWGTLINALLDFKRDYDGNVSLERVLPHLVSAHPERYGDMGLKDLCDRMFGAMADLKTTATMSDAFSVLPKPELSPTHAYERLVKGEVESLTLDQMAGRVVATGVVPYPPGIPLLMPGESCGAADGPVLAYLKALEAFDIRFPGFTHDTHGVEVEDGFYRVLCLTKEA